MKFIAIALGAFSLTAFAQGDDWLLMKNSGGGYTPPELVRWEMCKIYDIKKKGKYKVEIRKTFGELVSKKHVYVHLTGLEEAIESAELEPVVTTPNLICDAPTTTITAKLPGQIEAFTLFFTGGCGADEKARQGYKSSSLEDLLAQYCPKTYDFDFPPR